MKIAQLSRLHHHKKLILFLGSFFFITSCKQWAVDPEVQLGLILLTAIISFIVLFTRPIIGVYLVLLTSIFFNPKVHIGLSNIYLHQWIILIALIASISSSLILENLFPKIESEINFSLLLFLGTILLSLAHAPYFKEAIKWFFFLGVFFGSYYLFILSVTKKRQLEIFVNMLIFSTFVVCVISLVQGNSGRLGSLVLGNPNAFGNFLGLVIPFSVSFLFYGKMTQRKRLLITIALILMLVALVLTFSRSSWSGVLGGLFLLYMRKPKFSFTMFICFVLAAVLLVSPINKRIFKDINDPGAQYRIVKAKIAVQRFKSRPFLGNGLGSFHHEAQYSNVWAYRAHSSLENIYLLMLVEGGIVGLTAFLLFVFSYIKMSFRQTNKLEGSFILAVTLGSFSSFVSMLSAGFFEGTLYNPQYNWLIGMLMACPVIVKKLYKEEVDDQKDFIATDSGSNQIA